MQINNTKIYKYLDPKKCVRAAVVNATDAVAEMQRIQSTYPISTMLVGRSMVSASLMASQLKSGEMVSLYFRGDGPIEMVFAEANYEGEVRGYTPHPQLDLQLREGNLDIRGAMGKGTLSVVRTHSSLRQPYRGTVEIQTGEIGDDVAYYLMQSHQIPSVVSVGVKINAYGKVLSAGGIIIEMMPGADRETEAMIAENTHKAMSLSEALSNGATAREIAHMHLTGLNLIELEHPHALTYTCRCSVDRLKRSLELLSLDDLDDILTKKEEVQAKCEFCGRGYSLAHTEVQIIRDAKYRNTLN